MIRGFEDPFVTLVAVGLGLFILVAAVLNWDWFYSLPTARFVARRVGRNVARLLYGLVAMGLIALGIAIARGVRFSLFS